MPGAKPPRRPGSRRLPGPGRPSRTCSRSGQEVCLRRRQTPAEGARVEDAMHATHSETLWQLTRRESAIAQCRTTTHDKPERDGSTSLCLFPRALCASFVQDRAKFDRNRAKLVESGPNLARNSGRIVPSLVEISQRSPNSSQIGPEHRPKLGRIDQHQGDFAHKVQDGHKSYRYLKVHRRMTGPRADLPSHTQR